MKSLYHAFEAYERRVNRGEFYNPPKKALKPSTPREPMLVQFGDLLIQTGMRLKMRHAASKPMTWSPLIGSKP
jgi:hypothetical protein